MTNWFNSAIDSCVRLDAVERDFFVDGRPRSDLDWVAGLAQRALRAEASALSIVDSEQQHFVSQRGISTPELQIDATPLSMSLCRFVVEREAPLVVHDATEHRAFADHPAVTEFGVVSYAGVPVRSPDGPVLGALCVIGMAPRTWRAEDLADLEHLARIVRDEIELSARRALSIHYARTIME